MIYTLMNKNEKILDFEYNLEYDSFLGIKKIHSLKYAPLPLINCYDDEISNELFKWLNDRKIPPLRDNVKYLLDSLKEMNTMTSMMNSFGLSLSDQYWFLPNYQNITWEQINYFDNSYDSHMFFEATFGQNSSQIISIDNLSNHQNFSTPNISTNGQLGKCWIQQNGHNYLVKGANTTYRFEAICEYIASKVCEIFDVPHVKYQSLLLQGKRTSTIASVCPVMINKNQEFIPAYQVLNEKKDLITNTSEDYYLYLNILKDHHVPKAEEYLQKMIMIDYILANEDRHLGNFGIIRNADTLKWEAVCPIFDTGRSLNTNVSKDFWLDESVDMKFFTNHFISDSIVSSYFSLPIDEVIISKLFYIVDEFVEELQKYSSILNIDTKDISMLKDAFYKRIVSYKSMMENKNLLL